MKKIFFFFLFYGLMFGAGESFEDFKASQNSEYSNFVDEYAKYKKVFDEEFKSYKKEITKNFDKPDVTTNEIWVEYGLDFKTKKFVDFKNGIINLEVIAANEIEARQKLSKLFLELSKQNTKEAYKNDILEQNIEKKLGNKPKTLKEQPIISDVYLKPQIELVKKQLDNGNLAKTTYNDNQIFKLNIKMPPDYILKKAKNYQVSVKNQSEKNSVPQNLIFAIMHTESSFNPMARSNAPAYGLMQIVPHTAGIDINKFLNGNSNAPSGEFLYDGENNILFGSTLLHILQFKYLAEIKDPMSKLYCTICAYNTGSGNVARAFIGNNNIKQAANKINSMSSEEVYKFLLKNLPFSETKDYLVRVHERLDIYKRFLEDNK